MSNNYFAFKEFTIHQDLCAMKVTTDACIQGALAAGLPTRAQILDIGTGTGLLALMLAQLYPKATLDAVELDTLAAQQASSNFKTSPFGQRIQVHTCDITHFFPSVKYDYIICNPPFFINSLKNPDAALSAARHQNSLNINTLLTTAQRLLLPHGIINILLPTQEQAILKQVAQQEGLYLNKMTHIRHQANMPIKRIVTFLQLEPCETKEEELYIYASPGNYSAAFRHLLSPFYVSL